MDQPPATARSLVPRRRRVVLRLLLSVLLLLVVLPLLRRVPLLRIPLLRRRIPHLLLRRRAIHRLLLLHLHLLLRRRHLHHLLLWRLRGDNGAAPRVAGHHLHVVLRLHARAHGAVDVVGAGVDHVWQRDGRQNVGARFKNG